MKFWRACSDADLSKCLEEAPMEGLRLYRGVPNFNEAKVVPWTEADVTLKSIWRERAFYRKDG